MIKKSFLYRLGLFLCAVIPIVDVINGYNLLYNNAIDSKIGVIFRLFSLAYFFYLTFMSITYRRLLFILSLLLTLLISIIGIAIRTSQTYKVFDDITYMTKLLLPIFYAFGLSNGINLNIFPQNMINQIFRLYSIIVPFTLIIPKIFGLGFDSYLLGGGYKGLYFSNNELNVLLLSICTILFWKILNHSGYKDILLLIFNVFSMLMIGSKTSIIVIIILIVMYLFYKFTPTKLIIGVIAILLIGNIINMFFSKFINDLTYRFNYYYEITNGEDNIFNFLLSNRNLRIYPIFHKRLGENNFESLFNFLFGVGHSQQFIVNSLSSLVEMDLIDTFIWYGIFPVILFLIFYVYIGIIGIKYCKDRGYVIAYYLISSFSLLAGHVMYSALAGGIFGIVCAQLLSSKTNFKRRDVY